MKFRLVTRWYATGLDEIGKEGEPMSKSKVLLIDTEVNRKYDGAENAEDVRRTFLDSVTQDPTHSLILKIDECVQID